jgi:prepilin-type N-terminal cleavage/methylation domain-containing protein
MLPNCNTQKGFTLLELMVAVVVLLAVMISVGRIFSTTSDISASGRAISETLQQGVAMEQQLRQDIAQVSREGFFAIRSVAVSNDFKGEFLLLDDSLPAEDLIRFDQLVFFTDGIATPMLNTVNTDFAGQGLASMVYYGHGVRFSQLEGHGEGANNFDESNDPILVNNPTGLVAPWYDGIVEVETRKYTDSQNAGDPDERFTIVANGFYANGSQGLPNDWTLCRQAIILGDDDFNPPDAIQKTTYMGRGVSSHTIFPWDPRIGGNNLYPHVQHGRVDIAATQLDDIRQSVLQEVEFTGDPNRTWRGAATNIDQQELISSLFYWPRVEPYPPTAIRYDQALMMASLAEGCVSFKIEWTYDEGVGEATDANHRWFTGYDYDYALPQPWFGDAWVSSDLGDPYAITFDSLTRFTSLANDGSIPHVPAWSIDPTIIEPTFSFGDGHPVAPVPTFDGSTGKLHEYWAMFGYNANTPFFENEIDFLNDNVNADTDMDDGLSPGNPTWRYTPWPSALRITMRLLDRDNRLGAGWTYQFVVDLPEQKQ